MTPAEYVPPADRDHDRTPEELDALDPFRESAIQEVFLKETFVPKERLFLEEEDSKLYAKHMNMRKDLITLFTNYGYDANKDYTVKALISSTINAIIMLKR